MTQSSIVSGTVHDIVARGGRCLIPVFALGRAQELLLILDEYWASHPELHDIPHLLRLLPGQEMHGRCVRACVCVCVCVSACMRACTAVCVRACVHECVCVWLAGKEWCICVLHNCLCVLLCVLCAVYQTYVGAMNESIRRQIAISNPFVFKHISNLKVERNTPTYSPSSQFSKFHSLSSFASSPLFHELTMPTR